MLGKNTAVMAIFNGQSDVRTVMDRLTGSGFMATDVSVLMAESKGTNDFAHVKDTKAPEGATAGGATGAIVGGTLGWLVGAGTLALTGFGPLIAAGPILASLVGMGAGGAVGSMTGALIGMGIPEYEAKRYDGYIRKGKALVSVHCESSDEVAKATRVLKECGGEDIASRNEESAKSQRSDKSDIGRSPSDMAPPRVDSSDVRRDIGF